MDKYNVYFTLGKKKTIGVKRVTMPGHMRDEWRALFKVSQKYGKEFHLLSVNLETDSGEVEKISLCKECASPVGIGSHPVCPHGEISTAYAQRFDPVVIHVDGKGNYRFPGRNDAKIPQGYEKRELRTIQEVRAFEREFNKHSAVEHEQRESQRLGAFQARQAENRSELRSAMERMSPRGRDFAQFAIERNNNRRMERPTPVGFFEAFEMDASNRDPYSDRETGWKDRK